MQFLEFRNFENFESDDALELLFFTSSSCQIPPQIWMSPPACFCLSSDQFEFFPHETFRDHWYELYKALGIEINKFWSVMFAQEWNKVRGDGIQPEHDPLLLKHSIPPCQLWGQIVKYSPYRVTRFFKYGLVPYKSVGNGVYEPKRRPPLWGHRLGSESSTLFLTCWLNDLPNLCSIHQISRWTSFHQILALFTKSLI